MKKMKLILNESLISNKEVDVLEDTSIQAKPDFQIIDVTVIPDEDYYPTIQSILINLDENNKLKESNNAKLDINILSETVNTKTGYSNSLFEFESSNHTITLSLTLQETERRGVYKVEAYTTKGVKVFESNTYKPRMVIESYLNSLANEYLIDKPLKESEGQIDKAEFKNFAKRMKDRGFLNIKDMTSLSDNNFVDKLSFSDLNMFDKLGNVSYQDIQEMVKKALNEADEPVEDSWADEMGEGVPVDEEPVDKEEATEYDVSTYMRATQLSDEVKDLNINYSEWNEMTPEERKELVRPEMKRFVDSHKNEFDKNQQLFDLMIADLIDYNFHTEADVLVEEYRGGE